MIKVRCVDNENADRFLDEGRIYEVKHESNEYYFMAHDDRKWLKSRFEVVKDEEQMTHRQKMKELLPIIQAYCNGAEVERQSLHNKGEWVLDGNPQFMYGLNYRIKQTPDTIDWSHVHKDYKFMARDRSGHVYLYTGKPNKDISCWVARGWLQTKALSYASYKQGTVTWENSLVERPEGV